MIANVLKTCFAAVAVIGLTVSCTPPPALVVKDGAPAEQRPPAAADTGEDVAWIEPEVVPVRREPADYEGDMAFAGGHANAEFEQMEVDGVARREIPDFDLIGPVPGGKARIYLHRGFMDDAVAELVRANPFEFNARNRRIFTVTDSTHRRMEFQMSDVVRRGDGRRVTALDFIELWSRFLKSRPAQGLALFRNVQGAENFVNGKDPLVNGWSAADENTIRIRFAKPDPFAFQRMNTPKLLGGPFMLGAYYSAGSRGAETRLLPNTNSVLDTALLSECVIQMGGDPNPLMSFAAGQYSAMTFYLAADFEIARKELEENGSATIWKLSADRYFLACAGDDEQSRRFVHGLVDGAAMIRDAVKAEGEPIASVTARDPAIEVPKTAVPAPQLPKPFRIIYRDDDPVSKNIAETLLASLTGAGMSAEIIAQNAERYETALARKTYDCAVGWVPESILDSFAEQLHFTSMWFNDEIDPQARLREYREIPLFYVNNYILLRNDTRLHGDRLSGIWVLPAAEE